MKTIKLTIQATDENGVKSDPVTVDVPFSSAPVIDSVTVSPDVKVLGMPVTVKVASHHPDGTAYTVSVVADDTTATVTKAAADSWTVLAK